MAGALLRTAAIVGHRRLGSFRVDRFSRWQSELGCVVDAFNCGALEIGQLERGENLVSQLVQKIPSRIAS